MINQLSVPDFVKLTKMSITSVCDVADELLYEACAGLCGVKYVTAHD